MHGSYFLVVALGAAALHFAWQDSAAADRLESELRARVARAGGGAAASDIALGEGDNVAELRARVRELDERVFVDDARVNNLNAMIEGLDLRLKYAEAKEAYARCLGRTHELRADAADLRARCHQSLSAYAECSEKATEDGFAGCLVGAALGTVLTGGFGAAAAVGCLGGTSAATDAEACGPSPACPTSIEAALANTLRQNGLQALPVCTKPHPPPQSSLGRVVALGIP